LLPDKLPVIEGFSLAAMYQTSARAGGDYYDFFPLQGGRWGLFIGDVSGHGTPAAVLMAITHAIAHARPGEHTPPAALLAYLNDQLSRAYTRDGSFVTAFYAVLDAANFTLNYCRAGHNPPRLLRGNRVLSLDETGALPMGIFENQAFEEAIIAFEPGDLLLLYTDGITEAAAPRTGNQPSEIFGTDRLDKLLLQCNDNTTDQCIDRIRTAVTDFCGGAPPTDDQTLVAIRRNH
jgi:sigma-B regulation protein RsbU (phosphoserine phosphatase)